jgi:hypothetical protein
MITVVTCMGRLAHLKASLPTFPRPCVVVDYSCSERSGDWAEQQPGVKVVRVTGETFFHKSRALNLGAARAIQMGAQQLCFLDADTLVRPSFAPALKPKLACIAPAGFDQLVGVLVVSSADFQLAKGYDEAYRGWGVEDLDMRLRLYLLAGCRFERIPTGQLDSIPHSNDLRTKNYTVKNPWVSRALNAMLLERNIASWTDKGPADLDDAAKELMRV